MKEEGSDEESAEDTTENDSALGSENSDDNDEEDMETDNVEQDEDDDKKEEENDADNTSANTEEDVSENEEDSILDDYSAEEMEYARIWLQLGELQLDELNELNVRYISAGDPLNPDDDQSAEYPEDVIELRGGRQSGIITYSSNGDGTINEYNILPRWENNADEEVLQKTYKDIIENTELIEIDTGNPEDVKKVIDAYMIME